MSRNDATGEDAGAGAGVDADAGVDAVDAVDVDVEVLHGRDADDDHVLVHYWLIEKLAKDVDCIVLKLQKPIGQ